MAGDPDVEQEPSVLIDAHIDQLDDWRGDTLAQVRRLVHEALPDVDEQVKWRKPTNPNGVPVWASDGMICTGETYADKVKLTFAQGAALRDPAGLFNASLGGKVRRAIDIRQDDDLDEGAFKDLVQEAADHNAR